MLYIQYIHPRFSTVGKGLLVKLPNCRLRLFLAIVSFQIKYSLAVLAIISISSLLFTFFGLYILSAYLSFPQPYKTVFKDVEDGQNSDKLITEVVVSSAIASTITSLTTFFVVTTQLVLSLRMLKDSPNSVTRFQTFPLFNSSLMFAL